MMKSKRYLLFTWPLYRYVGGGWEDYEGDFDTPEAAFQAFEAAFHNYGNECYNIVDTETMRLVQAGTYGMNADGRVIDENTKCGTKRK